MSNRIVAAFIHLGNRELCRSDVRKEFLNAFLNELIKELPLWPQKIMSKGVPDTTNPSNLT